MDTHSMNRRRLLRLAAAVLAGLGVRSARARADERNGVEELLFLAIYRPGPNWSPGAPTSAQPLRDHGKYMLQLYARGRLRHAGRFTDDSGGAAVFTADSEEHAREIVANDPAVTDGVMTCTLQRWALVDWEGLLKRAASA